MQQQPYRQAQHSQTVHTTYNAKEGGSTGTINIIGKTNSVASKITTKDLHNGHYGNATINLSQGGIIQANDFYNATQLNSNATTNLTGKSNDESALSHKRKQLLQRILRQRHNNNSTRCKPKHNTRHLQRKILSRKWNNNHTKQKLNNDCKTLLQRLRRRRNNNTLKRWTNTTNRQRNKTHTLITLK